MVHAPTTSPTLGARALRGLNGLGLLAMLALLLTPLVIDPLARDDSYFGPKWAWIAIWTAIALAALLARAAGGRAVVLPLNGLMIATLLWLAWHWLATLWAPSRSLAFERAREVTWLTLAMWAGVQLFNRRRALLALGWGFVIVGIATAIWVLVEDGVRAWAPARVWITPNLPDWRGYLAAGLGNTSHIGDLLALALLPAAALWGEARGRRAWLGAALAVVLLPAGLIVSYSVGSNFALIAGAALMTGLVLRRLGVRWFTRRAPRWILLLAAWALVVGVFVTDQPLNPNRPSILKQGFSSARWAEGWPTRLAIWAESLEMIRLHPWRGVGTGNFVYVFPTLHSALLENRPDLKVYEGAWTNAGHNEILQTWAELGIGGLFIFAVLLIAAFHALLHKLDYADRPAFLIRVTLAGMLLAWLLQAQMNFSFQHPAGALTFYGLLTAILIEYRTRPRPGAAMPSLIYDVGPLRLKMEWLSMRRPTALGIGLNFSGGAALATGVVLLGLVAWWVPGRLGPVRAQREYALGVAAEQRRDDAGAEAHFRRALAFDPNCTNCASHYSDWLVREHRPREALAMLAIVRQRLTARELWLRESQAWGMLGDAEKSRRAMAVFQGWPESLEHIGQAAS